MGTLKEMSKSDSVSALESELRPSITWALVLLLAIALLLAVSSENQSSLPVQMASRSSSLLGFVMAGGAAALVSRRPLAARWMLIGASVIYVCLGSAFLDHSSIPVLMGIPVALGAQLLGLLAATLVAAGGTALLLAFPSTVSLGMSSSAVYIALIAVWATWFVMVGVYRPIYRLGEWLSWYFEHSQQTLETARDRKAELERALRDQVNLTRRLALANERVARLRQIAEEAQRAKAQFVANVSHEFRTPLNMILGLVDLMIDSPTIYTVTLPPELSEDLTIVRRNCEHLGNLVDDVLSLSQIEAGGLTLHKEQVDLAELVDAAAEAVRPLVKKKALDLQIAIPAGLPLVYCDRTRLQQVILNLVSNAARFTEAGRISVEAERQDGHITVSVADTGPGIPARDTERIFEPFCQGSSDLWRGKGGTGLGLTISREFVQHHGGRMWLSSQEGVGTTFYFELPITEPPGHTERPGWQIRTDWEWREDSFRGQRDFPEEYVRQRIIVCDHVGGLMSEFERYTDDVEFVNAPDLAQVSQALHHCPAHAVVVNAKEPEGVVARVSNMLDDMADTPIVGCSIPQRVERALAYGAIGYLVKPVTPADLGKMIDRLGTSVKRVLVVDDDPDFLQLMARMLRVYDESLQFAGAASGGEALRMMRDEPIDLVLLDVMLPEMDGWEVLERRNQDEALKSIPVVFVSGQDPNEEPLFSPLLVTGVGKGLSVKQTLNWTLEFSAFVLARAQRLGSGLLQSPSAEQVSTETAPLPATAPDSPP